MGAAAAEALRLPAAPPLAFCCYTSVLLLFTFSLPGSRASNQPAGGGSGGGGECPGGKGKSINCSGRTGRSLSLWPLPPPPPPLSSWFPGPDWERPRPGGPGERGPRAEGRARTCLAGLRTGIGDGEWPCVRPCVSSGWARVARRVGRW